MKNKVLGGILLIIGTTLGAGMLALPLVTAAGGYFHSLWLFLGVWLLTTLAALLLLEVNLRLPAESNLISMSRATLGWPMQALTWLSYLLLLYSVLAAYTAGGSDLLHDLLQRVQLNTPQALDTFLFVFILGAVVYRGIAIVDWANRGLMLVKLTAYTALITLVAPHVQVARLSEGHFALLSPAVMVVVTAFGYGMIVPSLRRYLNGHVNALRLTIVLGSCIALFCYLCWDFVIQGSVVSRGPTGLIHMAVSGHAASELTAALSDRLGSVFISQVTHVFTSVCMTTSFLGVSLCLSDFLTDGLHVTRHGWHRLLVITLTFLPPLVVVLLYPGAFIIGLHYTGVFCSFLLLLLPALMAWSGRYIKKMETARYQVWGGRIVLLLVIVTSSSLLGYGVLHLL